MNAANAHQSLKKLKNVQFYVGSWPEDHRKSAGFEPRKIARTKEESNF
jgi:hypothetical protein